MALAHMLETLVCRLGPFSEEYSQEEGAKVMPFACKPTPLQRPRGRLPCAGIGFLSFLSSKEPFVRFCFRALHVKEQQRILKCEPMCNVVMIGVVSASKAAKYVSFHCYIPLLTAGRIAMIVLNVIKC